MLGGPAMPRYLRHLTAVIAATATLALSGCGPGTELEWTGEGGDADAMTVDLAIRAPGSLKAVALSTTQVRLTWVDRSAHEKSFIVRMKPAGGTYKRVATLPANTTRYTHSGLKQNTTYSFQ